MSRTIFNIKNKMKFFNRTLFVISFLALPFFSSAQAGSLDLQFDSDGKVVTYFAGNRSYGYTMAIQSDGKIVVAGMSGYDIAVVRYNTNGS